MKNNLELATEIVIAMINTGHISKNENHKIDNERVTNALETVYNKLNELEKSNEQPAVQVA